MSANGRLPAQDLAPIAGGQLRKDAAAAWNAMNVEARQHGIELRPTGSKSSYRTFAQQEELRWLFLSGRGNLAAIPGTSNHGWGLAVDLATKQMRAMLDRIGAKYGWSKEWSDAPGEWWHIKYAPGHYSGPDPGPSGDAAPQPLPPPTPLPEGVDMPQLQPVLKQNGAIEVFVLKDDGEVMHTWQGGPNGGWVGAEKGKRNATWFSLGKP